eukprot:5315719-Pleurochrysis_carterae.AAC.2
MATDGLVLSLSQLFSILTDAWGRLPLPETRPPLAFLSRLSDWAALRMAMQSRLAALCLVLRSGRTAGIACLHCESSVRRCRHRGEAPQNRRVLCQRAQRGEALDEQVQQRHRLRRQRQRDGLARRRAGGGELGASALQPRQSAQSARDRAHRLGPRVLRDTQSGTGTRMVKLTRLDEVVKQSE